MTSTLFKCSHLYRTLLLSHGTCRIIKFTSNLKPQARNVYRIINDSCFTPYQKRIKRVSNMGALVLNFSLNEHNYFIDKKRFSCFSMMASCLENNLYLKQQHHQRTCTAFDTIEFSLLNCYPLTVIGNQSRFYSTKKPVVNNKNVTIKRHEYIKTVLRDNQKKMRQTQLHLKRSGRLILNDIKETKSKMKEKMEEIIERENIWTIPNFLCITRIVMSPYLGYLIAQENYNLALGLVVFAGITDLLDGLIARNFKSQSSKLGSFLDPMADKVLVATLFLTLTYSGNIPVPLTALIISRDVILFGAGFYIRYQSLPPPRTLSRYFDATHATAQLAPTTLSKINTTVQLVTVFTTLTAVVFDYTEHPALRALWYLTAVSTIASALSYLTEKNTYKILKRKKFR